MARMKRRLVRRRIERILTDAGMPLAAHAVFTGNVTLTEIPYAQKTFAAELLGEGDRP